MKKIFLFLIYAMLSFFLSNCQNAEGKNHFSRKTFHILNKSEQFELLSLNPIFEENAKDNFHGYKIIGRITVNEGTQKMLMNELQKGMTKANLIPMCFEGCIRPMMWFCEAFINVCFL